MLCYPEQRENPRLLQFIDDSLKTDLIDIERTYLVPGGNYWVATPQDEPSLVIGMVGLEVKPNNEGELRRMSVKNSHRRYGVGRLLLSALEQWAMKQQFRKIWLTTGSVMQKARDFYVSVGYVETDAYLIREEFPVYGVVKLEKDLTA
ncbi:N-acetyltransferase-like protein [Phytophthora megakarya]|uniref:N-acetyltransferase-like protein n=1 Tax=Phytophthora megakarya TaxID=4795 RepID=A0A225VGV5_9STRA|nr:N-acetyltransferase-like protein [Phytophthora megakarya]